MFREGGPSSMGLHEEASKRKGFEHTGTKRLKEDFGMETDVETLNAIVHPDSDKYDADITELFLPAEVQSALDLAVKAGGAVRGISVEVGNEVYKLRSVGQGGKEMTHIIYRNGDPISVAKSVQMKESAKSQTRDPHVITPWETFVEPAANAIMHLPLSADGSENITQIKHIDYDTENHIGRVEFAFANGGDLDEIAKVGLLSEEKKKPEVVVALLEETAKGLRYMQKAGLMHRDIKPANIVLNKDADGTIKAQLTDFGLISTIPQEQKLLQGLMVGSTPFMDKGVLEHQRTMRSDIYALGMTMAVSLFGMKEVWHSFVQEKIGKDPKSITAREGFDVARKAAAGELHDRVQKLLQSSYDSAAPEMKKVYDVILAMLDPKESMDLDAVIAVAHEAAEHYGGSSVLLESIFPKDNAIAVPGPDKNYMKYDASTGEMAVPPPPEGTTHPAFEDDGEDGDVGGATGVESEEDVVIEPTDREEDSTGSKTINLRPSRGKVSPDSTAQ